MDAVDALDPSSYSGTYKLVAGTPALDFANLVSYRHTDQRHDWLDPATNAPRWCEAAGIAAEVRCDVSQLRDFREVVARTFLAIANDAAPAAADVNLIGRLAADAWAHRQLRFPSDASAATWTGPPTLLGVIAIDAASLLTEPQGLERVGACHECRWLFLDATRNRSRRWCDPADCGNRARQRRYYQRHHG